MPEADMSEIPMEPVNWERVLTLQPENALSGVIVNLKVGDVVAARVVKALAAQRLLLTFDGQPLRVQSGIEVPVGAELQLRVREIGRTVVLDLVRVEAPSARRAAATPAALSGPTSARSGPAPQAETRALHAEVAAAIAQLRPMGRVALEIENLLGALPETLPASRSSASLAQLTHGLRGLVFPRLVEAGSGGATALAKFDPAIVLQLLKLIESITGEQMQADPQARALDALLSVINQSSAVHEGLLKEREAAPSGLAPAAVSRAKMAELLERLLSASVSERHASATEALAAAVDKLDPEEKLLVAALATSREQALVAASPEAAWLGRVHQALSDALANEALSRLTSLMLSEDGKSFGFVQILGGAGEETVRLRVQRKSDDAGGGTEPGRDRPLRAVLDVTLSALGEVWAEVSTIGRDVAARFELADAERSVAVAHGLPELRSALEAHGLRTALSADVRRAARDTLSGEPIAQTADSARLDLWA
jgi:hypothetical protein